MSAPFISVNTRAQALIDMVAANAAHLVGLLKNAPYP